MGDEEQGHLDYLAAKIHAYEKKLVELLNTVPRRYKDDINFLVLEIDDMRKQIENAAIGTDAYRCYWEGQGQRRLPFAE